MRSPPQILQHSATRYQLALASLLKFWRINGECKYCNCCFDVAPIIQEQIKMEELANLTLVKK